MSQSGQTSTDLVNYRQLHAQLDHGLISASVKIATVEKFR